MLSNEKPDLITVLRRRKREIEEFIEDLVKKGLTEEELKEKLEKEYKIHPFISNDIRKAIKEHKTIVEEETQEKKEITKNQPETSETKPKRKYKKRKTDSEPEQISDTDDKQNTYIEESQEDSNSEGESNEDVEQDQE